MQGWMPKSLPGQVGIRDFFVVSGSSFACYGNLFQVRVGEGGNEIPAMPKLYGANWPLTRWQHRVGLYLLHRPMGIWPVCLRHLRLARPTGLLDFLPKIDRLMFTRQQLEATSHDEVLDPCVLHP